MRSASARGGYLFVKIESEIHCCDDEEKGDNVIPARRLPEQEADDNREDDDGNAFLHNFELDQSEVSRADTIGRDLEKIFKKCEKPACKHYQSKRLVFEFQVPIPGESHEDVRDEEEQRRSRHRSINFLKLRRYLSTRRPTAPPKLEVSFKVIRVARSGWDTN